MDEIRRYTGRQDDGDPLLRAVVGVGRRIGFSSNSDDNERGVTEGLKMILQGLYKGVRNPASHGYDGYSRLEAFQILVMCSFLLAPCAAHRPSINWPTVVLTRTASFLSE